MAKAGRKKGDTKQNHKEKLLKFIKTQDRDLFKLLTKTTKGDK